MLLASHRRRIRPPLPPPPAHVHVSPRFPPTPSSTPHPNHSPLSSYPQIEKNKSVHLSQFFTGSYATGGALRDTGFEFDDDKWAHLEACFPFDPFQLPVARRWLDLQNSYVSWQPMAVLDGLEEDEDEEDDGDEEGEEDGEGFVEDTATDEEEGGI